MSYKKQKNMVLVTFLFLPLLILLTFSYYPAVRLLQYSFTDWDGLSKQLHYIGLDNYKEIFTTPETFSVFAHNAAYFVFSIAQTIVGLFLAVILNNLKRGSKLYRSTLFMPYIMNSVAVAYMFAFLYEYNSGGINTVLQAMGIGKIAFLSNPLLVNFSLATVGFWRFTGFSMVVFLGALQSVDTNLYEAASIDGANAWRKFTNITLPSIKTIVELQLFLSISGAMKAFDEAFAITKGGPNGASETFVMRTMSVAFEHNNFGFASAMGIVLMVIILIVTRISNRLAKK